MIFDFTTTIINNFTYINEIIIKQVYLLSCETSFDLVLSYEILYKFFHQSQV